MKIFTTIDRMKDIMEVRVRGESGRRDGGRRQWESDARWRGSGTKEQIIADDVR